MINTIHTKSANSGRNLPAIIGTPAPRRSLGRVQVASDFASQLIAARDHLPVQRLRRRANSGFAIGAYDRGARIADQRVPAGYRLSISV